MADVVSVAVRSRMMAGIRGRDTKPEMIVRRTIHAAGYRYRLHARGLPGKPDLVLARHRTVVFVNGCFWHVHDCGLFKWPSSNAEFWRLKLLRNREVDGIVRAQLAEQGWRVLDIWECSLKGPERLPDGGLGSRIVGWMASGESRGTVRGRVSGRKKP